MARVDEPGYMSYVFDTIKRELNLIGIHVDNMNIREDHNYGSIHSASSYHPMHQQVGGGVVAEIEFSCSEDDFVYLRPFVQQAEMRRERIPGPVGLYNVRQEFNLEQQFSIHEETRCICVMKLHATGGSMNDFIESFRKGTEELRYAVESKKFDNEVDKMLREEDEYND